MMLAMGVRRRTDPLSQAVRSYYGRWTVYALIFSFLPGFNVDIAAHIGGLAGGFIIGWLAGLPVLPNTPRENLWKALAGLAIAATLYAFAQDFLFYSTFARQVSNN